MTKLYIVLKKRGQKRFSRVIKVKKYRSRTKSVQEARRVFGKEYIIKSVRAKNLNEIRERFGNRNL